MNQLKSTAKWVVCNALTALLILGTASPAPNMRLACFAMLMGLSIVCIVAAPLAVLMSLIAKRKQEMPEKYLRPVPQTVEAITDLTMAFLAGYFSGSAFLLIMFLVGSIASWVGRSALIDINAVERGEKEPRL